MDRFSDSNFDQKTIYEIYRACRLCGAGAGYKMPIIQNVVDLDGRDVELKQKIRECVQIEVSQDDKMPPLICELCVDKVNDFYEFFDMCRQTNKKTRQRLGLPLQTLARGTSETSDCILGITEPVYCKDDSDEPLSKNKSKVKGKVKKEEAKIKVEPEILEEKRSSRSSPATKRRTRNSQPSPPPTRRRTDMQQQGKKTMEPLKSILKKEKVENDLPRMKRLREKDTQPELPAKRVKIAAKPITKSPPSRPTRKPSPKPSPKPNISRTTRQSMHACSVCGAEFKSVQSLSNHQRIHPKKLLLSSKTNTGKNISAKTNTSKPQKNNHCQSKETKSLPSIQSDFTCNKCERVYSSQRSLLRHQSSCASNQKALEAVIDPAIISSLRKVEIRVARCDSILTSSDTCRVSDLEKDYGVDDSCVYPYISSVRSLRVKNEPVTRDGMVAIGEEIKRQIEEGAFVHWDSDNSSDTDEEFGSESKRRPERLSRLALKTIYSERFLGKVPRKRKHIKLESRHSVEKFDDDNLTIGEDISEKVADCDHLRKEENDIDEVNKDTEDCIMDDHDDSTKQNAGDSDEDGSCVSTKANDSLDVDLSKDCSEEKANIKNKESLDCISSEENSILNIRDTIVNKVIPKSSLSVNDDVKETDGKQELVAEEKMSQDNDINKERIDANNDEVNGTIVNNEENCENVAQNTEKSEEITSNDGKIDTEGDENISTDDKNGITDRDGESEGDSKILNDAEIENAQQKERDDQEEMENIVQMIECDIKNGKIADKCVANGVADLNNVGSSEENKEDFSDIQFGIENDIAVVRESTEENRLGLNGSEFTDEMDRKLMEELDAQIGECGGEGDSACDRDKITLADLLPDKAHERLDLDSIADEFNFDP